MAQRNDGKNAKIIIFFLVIVMALLGGYQLLQAGKRYIEDSRTKMNITMDRAINKASE